MTVSRFPKVGGKFCLDPGVLYHDHQQLGIPTDFWGRANSITCPVGMEPGSAWFLVSRAVGDALGANSYHDITWTHENGTTTWQKYVLHRAVLVGLDGDGKAPYLIELRDKRQVLKFGVVDREYNVRRTTRQGDTGTTDLYYEDSRNSSSDWTWQTMFDDLWGNLPSGIRGTAPTLAYTPASEPENFRFHGSAWEAIGEVLELLQSVLCYDPIGDAFTVQRIGAEQSGLTAARAAVLTGGRRMLTYSPRQDLNLAVAPATIRFFFLKRMEDESQLAESDDGGPLVDPYHVIDKTTSLSGAEAGSILSYRTEFIAEVDADGSTINNSSTLDTLAGEIRDKIVDRINRGTERGRDWWQGIVSTVKPGSEIHEIVWRDYGDGGPHGLGGCVTEWRRDATRGLVKERPKRRLLPITSSEAVIGIPFINVSGFTIPPGGIMQVNLSTTIGGTDYYRVIRPSITFDRRWLVNGQTPVANGATSLGSWLDDLAGFAAIDPGSASHLQTIFGWGPRPDSFLLFPAYFGFSIDGNTSYTLSGQLVAQARQHEVNKLIGLKLMDEMEFDSHARAKIWHRDHLFLRRETDFAPIDLFDGFKLEEGDDPLPVGLRVDAVWNGNEWELAGAACRPAEESQSQQSAQSQFGNGVSPQQVTTPNFPSSPSFM